MINLLTKIRDYVKLLLPNDQKPLLLSNIQPDQKEVASENTGFVSPSENIPAENKQSSQAYTDKECDFIIVFFYYNMHILHVWKIIRNHS